MAATVCVDFDGVIHDYRKGWHDGTIYGEPMPGAIEGLRRLQQRYAVAVFTSRHPMQICRWLEDYGVAAIPELPEDPVSQRMKFWNHQDVILVTNRKLPAVAYLDDRAVRFTDWGEVDEQLAELANYRKDD